MLTPTQVARHANCTPQSIRNWSREYADLLSPQASGQAGPRLFTDEDAEILCLVAALRKSGVSRDETRQRILNREARPVVDVEPTIANEAKTGLNDDEASYLAWPTRYGALQGAVEALARRVDEVVVEQRAQTRDALWWGRLQGIWIGIVLMAAIFFAVWLAVNGV